MVERALRMREAPGSKPGVSSPFFGTILLLLVAASESQVAVAAAASLNGTPTGADGPGP